MRIGLIQVMQETCSFNPTPTTLADFASFGILEGAEMLERSDSAGPIGGYLDAVARSGTAIETVPIIRGTAQSGGRLTSEAFDFFDAKVRDGLAGAGELDGVVMLLHGAASADGLDDVEGALLDSAREVVGPDTAGRRDARPPRQRDGADDRTLGHPDGLPDATPRSVRDVA